jgi:hypothetical protein
MPIEINGQRVRKIMPEVMPTGLRNYSTSNVSISTPGGERDAHRYSSVGKSAAIAVSSALRLVANPSTDPFSSWIHAIIITYAF